MATPSELVGSSFLRPLPAALTGGRHPLLRIRCQLTCGLLLAVGLPFAVHLGLASQISFPINYQVTIIATLVAHLIGYALYRRLDLFPGVATFSTLLPAFAVSYGLAFLVIFFLRLDYSRLQAAGSFLIAVTWYFGLKVFMHRTDRRRLAIIPGGEVKRLAAVDGVIWERLAAPQLNAHRVDGVVADLRADLSQPWRHFITDCVLSGTPVYHVKQILESLTGRVAIEHLSENTLGSLNPDQFYFGVKQVIDRAAALVVLVLGAPLLLLLALAIRLDSPGPALFRQERMGYRGAPFTVYKFRTMHPDGAGEDDGADRTADKDKAMTCDNDPRITRVGRLLRRSRIDELPQAINILRGEMSWIGPRPEAVALSRWYESELPFYRYRHIVPPGITGWAQVNQGHVTSVGEVHDKLYYDFYYIKNFSPWLDLVVALRTVRIMLTGCGAK